MLALGDSDIYKYIYKYILYTFIYTYISIYTIQKICIKTHTIKTHY